MKTKERLVQIDYQYGEAEVKQGLFNRLGRSEMDFYGTPRLKWSQSQYDSWEQAGKPLEWLVGTKENRPPYYLEKHSNRVSIREFSYDQHSIHPYFEMMVVQSDRGVVTGPGWYRQIGANKAVDLVLFRQKGKRLQTLLITRGDGGGTGTIGGMMEKADFDLGSPEEAIFHRAMAEGAEEAGIEKLLATAKKFIIHRESIIPDLRTTAQSYPVSSAVLFIPDNLLANRIKPVAGDDAKQVVWQWVDAALKRKLFGASRGFIKEGILRYEKELRVVVWADGRVDRA